MSDVRLTERSVLFWGGWPSQWFKCRFEVDGVRYNCCEQFMMAEKARVITEGAGALSLAAALTGEAGEGPIVAVVSGGLLRGQCDGLHAVLHG